MRVKYCSLPELADWRREIAARRLVVCDGRLSEERVVGKRLVAPDVL